MVQAWVQPWWTWLHHMIMVGSGGSEARDWEAPGSGFYDNPLLKLPRCHMRAPNDHPPGTISERPPHLSRAQWGLSSQHMDPRGTNQIHSIASVKTEKAQTNFWADKGIIAPNHCLNCAVLWCLFVLTVSYHHQALCNSWEGKLIKIFKKINSHMLPRDSRGRHCSIAGKSCCL